MADTFIAAGLRIDGTIRGGGALIVEGEVVGDIDMGSDVLVRPSGRVLADIKADSVNVSGVVCGNIRANSFVHITKDSKVKGDITGPSVNIERGAMFAGRMSMGDVAGLEQEF